jgi:acetyl-CoA carboxylase carboxyl transferase subunit alpha
LKELNLIDRIIDEPLGGAHRDVDETISRLKAALLEELADLDALEPDDLIERRYKRLQGFGQFRE